MSTDLCIWLSSSDQATLKGWVADRNTPQKLVWRSRIVLLSAAAHGTMSIMRAVGKSKPTVWRWQERYLAEGIGGLQRDATRPGRKPALTAEVIAEVVEKTLREKPPAATHWSTRRMARAVGLSHTSVKRIWHGHGLKPHLTRPSVPMKVRHLSPGIFRLEGAEGSSHSCPCSRSRLIQQVAPSRSVCADRRLYRRHPLRHPNSPIARGDGRSLPRTSCAS